MSHNYLLVYSPDPERWKTTRNRLPRTEAQAGQYKNPDGDPRGPWRAIPWDAPNLRPNLTYPITTPSGRVRLPPPGRHWSRTESQWLEIANARLNCDSTIIGTLSSLASSLRPRDSALTS